MNEKTLINLQRYIGKRNRGESDSDVIEYIEKISSKEEITQNEWEKLLFPTCADCALIIFEYILSKLIAIQDPKVLIMHTLRFRKQNNDDEKRQVTIIDKLFGYVSDTDKPQVRNEALVNAVWFGEFEAAQYLIHQGADVSYRSQGRSMVELSMHAVKAFKDDRVNKMLEKN